MSTTDPTRPKPTPEEKRRENEIKMQSAQINSYAWPCCLNCEHFDKEQEVCKHYAARPPLNVVLVGCIGYTADIPF